MSTVTPIQSATAFTQQHRDAMARVQELAITVSQQGIYAINVEYSGQVHEFSAAAMLYTEIAKGNFKAPIRIRVDLPGRYDWTGHDALKELKAMARVLEGFLVPPPGDAA